MLYIWRGQLLLFCRFGLCENLRGQNVGGMLTLPFIERALVTNDGRPFLVESSDDGSADRGTATATEPRGAHEHEVRRSPSKLQQRLFSTEPKLRFFILFAKRGFASLISLYIILTGIAITIMSDRCR